MKSIISASRRTDIPAFYLYWLMDKIKYGFVDIQNPFNQKMIRHVDLRPESVEWIVFWSRNYGPFLKNRHFFSNYRLFFHFTIVTHHPLLEKEHLAQSRAIQQMERISHLYGPDRIIWRYDPIVFWRDGNEIHSNFDMTHFNFLAKTFAEMGIKKCYFSFVTDYLKYRRRFKRKYPYLQIVTQSGRNDIKILKQMKNIALDNNITLYSCCNDRLISTGVSKGQCISGNYLNKQSGEKIVSEAKAPSRPDCGCTKSIDIGDYQAHPCHYGCIYCYANPVPW